MNDDGWIGPIQKALKPTNTAHASYDSNSKHIKGSDEGGSPTWIHILRRRDHTRHHLP